MKKQVSLILALTLLCSVFVLPNMAASAASTRPRTATVDELHDAHAVSVGYPVMAKITDGDLYVWGTNGSTSPLGLGETKTYTSPVKIDRSVFGGFGIIKAGFHDCGCMAVSEEGKLYQASTATWTEVQPTNGQQLFDGGKILDTTFGAYFGMGAKVQATDGSIQWWVLPRTPNNQYRVDTPEMMALFKSATGKDEVIKEVWCSGPATLSTGIPSTPINAVLVLMESGELFGWGENLRGQIPNGWGADGKTKTDIPKTTPYRVTSRPEFSGRKIKQLSLEYNTVVALDDKGTIWTWGSSAGGKLGNGEWMFPQKADGRIHEYFVHPNDLPTPYAAFGPGSVNYSNKRAHYIMTSADHSVVVMTTDNELYGWGGNLSTFYPKEEDYLIPQPIFENVTEKETVLSVRATRNSFYVTTQSQDDYFAGDNSGGLAGNGSTSSTPTTEATVTKPENIPPTKPSSANKLFMTISTTTDNGVPIEYSAQANNINDLSIRVGQQFTLNIYMEDFAKLTGFYIPITFDPSILQVVNMDGVPYSADDAIRPGFNNGSGLRTNLTSGNNDPDSISTSWVNGVLTDNSRMPVIDNGNGFVSVEGVALMNKDLVSRITGQVKMFSIEFKAIQPTATVPTPATTGFKLDGTSADPLWTDKPAKWYSTDLGINSDLDVGKDAVWEFDNVSFFESKFKVVEIKDMILNLYRDNDSLVTDIANDGSGKPDYYRIDKRNTDSSYQLKAEVDPTNASWPDIDRWECEFMDSTSHATGATVSDYITVTKSDSPKYFEFTISPNISMSDAVLNDDGEFVPGYIKITGYGSHIPNKDNNPEGFRVAYIKITNDVPAPTAITITNKDGYLTDMNGKFQVNASTKLEFDGKGITLEDSYTFQAAFTAEDENDFSTDVKWQLLRVLDRNDDGSPKTTEALGTDAKAPMVIATDSANTNPKTPSCKVIAQNSTEDNDDIILKVSSGVDPTICDYVNVKVRLAPYEIVLPNDTITLVYGEGLKQTYDLADKVKVAPGDAKDYTIEYVKTVKAVDNRPDADRGDESKRVAPNVIVTDAGVIEPVRADKDFHAQSYDEVTVQIQQTLNGTPLTLQKTLKVYTVDAVPPPNMYVDVINSAGIDYDYIKFSIGTNKSQLEEGDKLEIYRDYSDTDAIVTYASLTADQIRMLFSPGYNVPTRTVGSDTYALNPAGGTIGYRLTKADGTAYKKTPVMYNPKALKLSGYIKLDTKSLTKSTHDGITITINDVVGSDGKSISTTTKANGVLHGYFEFEEYISAKQHTMTISKTNYLTRQIVFTMPSTEDFEISTAEKPIILYPGDLDGKRGIQYDDFNEYRINWLGRYNSRNENGVLLESFNFYDGSDENGATIININDLMLINKRMGATTTDYSPWLVN